MRATRTVATDITPTREVVRGPGTKVPRAREPSRSTRIQSARLNAPGGRIIDATQLAVLGRAGLAVSAVVIRGARSTQTAVPAADHDAPSRPVAATGGQARPYQLYTHCGIDEARIGNRYFEAVHPLSDGPGNPPAGWGNPYQRGTMTLLSSTEALFRDGAGHRVLFRLRPGARSFQRVCA